MAAFVKVMPSQDEVSEASDHRLVSNITDPKHYWVQVYKGIGNDGDKLRDLIVGEHTGMGVTAALVLTIAVGCLSFAGADYKHATNAVILAYIFMLVLCMISSVYVLKKTLFVLKGIWIVRSH